MDLVSATYVAKELGVKPSAVRNWIRRRVLPDALLPAAYVDHGTAYPTPAWDRAQMQEFKNWHKKRHPVVKEIPSLEEEATMSLYGDYSEPEPIREPYYDDDYSGDRDFYPGDDEDDDTLYEDMQPGYDYEPSDMPSVPTFSYVNDELYDRLDEDDPVETDDPDDMRGWR